MSGVNWIPAWALGGTDRDDRFRVVSDGRVNGSALRNWYSDPLIVGAQARLASRDGRGPGRPRSRLDVGPRERELELRDTADPVVGARVAATGSPPRSARPTRAPCSRSACTWRTWRTIACSGHVRRPRYATSSRCTAIPSTPAGRTARRTSTSCRSWPMSRAGSAGEATCCSPSSVCRPTAGAIRSARRRGGKTQALSSRSRPRRPTPSVRSRRCRRAGCVGAMLWCYTDYDSAIWHDPPLDLAVHERSFGLWRADGSPKPSVAVVEAIRRCSATRRPGRIPMDRSGTRRSFSSSRTWRFHVFTLGIA